MGSSLSVASQSQAPQPSATVSSLSSVTSSAMSSMSSDGSIVSLCARAIIPHVIPSYNNRNSINNYSYNQDLNYDFIHNYNFQNASRNCQRHNSCLEENCCNNTSSRMMHNFPSNQITNGTKLSLNLNKQKISRVDKGYYNNCNNNNDDNDDDDDDDDDDDACCCCYECEYGMSAEVSPFSSCCDDQNHLCGSARNKTFAPTFAMLMKRSQYRNQTALPMNQKRTTSNKNNIDNGKGKNDVSHILAHGRQVLNGSTGYDSGIGSGAISARSGIDLDYNNHNHNNLLSSLSKRLGAVDLNKNHNKNIIKWNDYNFNNQTESELKKTSNNERPDSNNNSIIQARLFDLDHHKIIDNNITDKCYKISSIRHHDESADNSKTTVIKMRAKKDAIPSSYNSVLDESTLEKYKYDRKLTNSIDAKSEEIIKTTHAKKRASGGFFATHYAKLTEKRLSIGRLATGFTTSANEVKIFSGTRGVPVAALNQTKSRSKTSLALLNDPIYQQHNSEKRLSLLSNNSNTHDDNNNVNNSKNETKQQRGSLLSLLPMSFSSYRLAGLLGHGSDTKNLENINTKDQRSADVTDLCEDGKRPLSWTGLLADSLIDPTERRSNYHNSIYRNASGGWDSGFYGDVDNNDNTTCDNKYDRIRSSTTMTSGYGSFNEKFEDDEKRSTTAVNKIENKNKNNFEKLDGNSRFSLPVISNNSMSTSKHDKNTKTASLFVDTICHENIKNQNNKNTKIKGEEEKIIIQASTSELLNGLCGFIAKKCCRVRDIEPSSIISWLRAVDRALIMQGWQDVAFINPANLVFVYMLFREHFNDDDAHITLVTIDDVQMLVLTCLYVSYSYMGNEISYPLKPFVSDRTDRVAFWKRCMSLISAHSSRMLELNTSSAFFLDVFTELKELSYA